MRDWVSRAIDTYLLHMLHGNGYQFWSGVGANIAVIGGLGALYRKHNCHVRRCFRLGRHPVEGTDWVVCRVHHPKEQPKHYLPTPDDIEAAHKEEER